MNTTNTETMIDAHGTEIDWAGRPVASCALQIRADRLARTDRYLPGRAHFAQIIGRKCLEQAMIKTPAMRATMCERAMRMFLIAGDLEGYNAASARCADLLGVARRAPVQASDLARTWINPTGYQAPADLKAECMF